MLCQFGFDFLPNFIIDYDRNVDANPDGTQRSGDETPLKKEPTEINRFGKNEADPSL